MIDEQLRRLPVSLNCGNVEALLLTAKLLSKDVAYVRILLRLGASATGQLAELKIHLLGLSAHVLQIE